MPLKLEHERNELEVRGPFLSPDRLCRVRLALPARYLRRSRAV